MYWRLKRRGRSRGILRGCVKTLHKPKHLPSTQPEELKNEEVAEEEADFFEPVEKKLKKEAIQENGGDEPCPLLLPWRMRQDKSGRERRG